MDRLEDLWICISNTTLPRPPSAATEKLNKCKALLLCGITEYGRLSKREATMKRSEEVLNALQKSPNLRRQVADDDLDRFAILIASLVHTLYLDVQSAAQLVEKCALAEGKTMASLLKTSSESALDATLKYFFAVRRMMFSLHRYIHQSMESFDSARSHPYQALFGKFAEEVGESDFHECLLAELGVSLELLRDYAENPSAMLQATWLSFQLQDLRDLLLVALEYSGQLSKSKPTLESIIRPLITAGQCLQRFPVSADRLTSSVQLQLVQQVNAALTVFVFQYLSSGVHIFLRDEQVARYLDEALPTGSSLASACPAGVLWFISRIQADGQSERAVENLDRILNELNPFALLDSVLRSEFLASSSKEDLAASIFDLGEQCIRLFGMENLGQLLPSLYHLSGELFKYPKEAHRFWQRWTEGAGTDIHFGWARLYVAARDLFPVSFVPFLSFSTGLLRGLPAKSAAVARLDRTLWDLHTVVEEVPVDGLRNVSLVKAEGEGVSTVRTEIERFARGAAVPMDTLGLMVNRGPLEVQLKWILSETDHYSVWTVCGHFLSRILTEWKEHFAESCETVRKISGFYCAGVKAHPGSRSDLVEVLQLLCRSLGCLFHAIINGADQSVELLNSVVQLVFDVCRTDVEVLGYQFLHDFEMLAPAFPKVTHNVTSDAECIRVADLSWFSALWQALCQKSDRRTLTTTLNGLACVQRTSIELPGGLSSTDVLLQQNNFFLLNIGLQFLVQLEDPSEGDELLRYVVAVLQNTQAVTTPSISVVALDCLLEGPAGQALVELLNRSNRTLTVFIRNLRPTAVEDFAAKRQVTFVQLVLEAIERILHSLPVRPPNHVTSFEHALLVVEKTRQMESISVQTGDHHHRHPVSQLIRLITQTRDAGIVRYATTILSRLVVLQQPSLTNIAQNDTEEFMKSVYWLLQEGPADVVVELWKFLTICDAKQPRLLDLLINLTYSSESKKFVVDVESIPSLLDVALETILHPSSKAALSAVLCFCLEIFSTKNDYIEHLSMNNEFWRAVFETLEDIPKTSLDWSEKLSSAYAANLISLAVSSRSLNSILLSPEMIESDWTPYFTFLLPRIHPHMLKEIPKMLHGKDEESESVQVATRFFLSWSTMHLLTFQKEEFKSVVTEETRLTELRFLFVLLNRSLLSSSSGAFVQAVAAALSQFLHCWHRDVSLDFVSSVFHIVEELTVFVCGGQEQENWNDLARHAILSVTLKVLDLSVARQHATTQAKAQTDLPAVGVSNVLKAAVEVIDYSALTWDPRDGNEDARGVMLSYAVDVVKNCVRWSVGRRGGRLGDDGREEFQGVLLTSGLYETLLTKVVQLISCQRLPLIAQSFLGLFLLMSEFEDGAATLNQTGFSTCLARPLSGLVSLFKELLVERDLTTATIEDVVASKERSVEGQDVFEVYLAALAIQFNIVRSNRFRFEDALKFIGAQTSACISEVLEALKQTPTMFTFRLCEMLTRLNAEGAHHAVSATSKSACLRDMPAVFHALSGQFMRRADKLLEDPKNLATPTMELLLSSAINCLQILNCENPGIAQLLTDEDFLTDSSSVKVIVDCSFANPAAINLSPNLSFGTFIHIVKGAVKILSQADALAVYGLVFAEGADKSVTSLSKLVEFAQRTAHFFLFQAIAFAAGLTDLTGERWQETLRELNNEIVDLRHVLHNFLTLIEDAAEPNSPNDSPRPTSLLSLLVENMMSFRNFYDDAKYELGGGEPATGRSYQNLASLSTPKSERKRVTFQL
ncbi:hypothetical protein BV898_16682 [Hypsibius exemplaris]|uniref:Uncharacterized protein n=1 Tax=Hypsibius exemplaris TaxID=2072580 RepID=A0A9X6NME5_HYPEX|nr:hypothetical protein BV898_16682 [Hypsibius exemplaris]